MGYFYTYVTNLAQTKVYYNNFTAHLQQHLNAAQRNFRDANPAAKQCGNMRGNIRQLNDYYPYGLTWSRPEGDDACMYQNKQWQQNEWGEGRGLEMYDFHARMYDPILARWHAPDPMNQFDSPYNAMGNNPVVNIDPDGMQVPWAGILSALSRIQITETVKHCTNAARMTFENITVSKNLFGQLAGVMDVAGGLLAFGEGALILSEGQKEVGLSAINSLAENNTLTGDPDPSTDRVLFYVDTYNVVRFIKRLFGNQNDADTKHHGFKFVKQTETKLVKEEQYIKLYKGKGSTLPSVYSFDTESLVGWEYHAYDSEYDSNKPVQGIKVTVTLNGTNQIYGSPGATKSTGESYTPEEASLEAGGSYLKSSGLYVITIVPTAETVEWEFGFFKTVEVERMVTRRKFLKLGQTSK